MPSIETEHLLLGLIREPKGHARRLLFTLPLNEIRREFESSRTAEKIPTSVEIPFSAETIRVLHHACDEADGLTHRHIGTEHLLLGLLREPESRAGAT
ncbi:MAG TPA: Clp protease N-terminal domain-containing protein, partial [Vicinamibacterales bacterium]|nr:Clp protease N-terminal domain-containing protein [Vicinamibacterales bacterium]